MSIFSRLFPAKSFGEWSEFVHSNDDLKKIALKFFLPDEIRFTNFIGNYTALKNESDEIISYQGNKLIPNTTSSIKKLLSPLDRPIGYPQWFVASYPDVVVWIANLSESEQENLLGNLSENDFDHERMIKPNFLRHLVEIYRYRTKKKLECQK